MAHDYELRQGSTNYGRKGWEVGYEERGSWYCVSVNFESKADGEDFLKVMRAHADRKRKAEEREKEKEKERKRREREERNRDVFRVPKERLAEMLGTTQTPSL